MKRTRVLLVVVWVGLAIAALLVVVLRPRPEILYEVTFLPEFNGASLRPRAINDHGQVVGVYKVAGNEWHMFVWDEDGGARDLGPCADAGRYECVQINNAGQIAGVGVDPNGSTRAFLRDPNGVRHILRAPGGERVSVYGLNNRGQVAGCYHAERGPRQAFVWDRAGGMQSLGGPSMIESLARSINDAGQAVGFLSVDRTNQWYAVLWDPNAGMRSLGLAPFGPTSTCHINNGGFVVGQFGSVDDPTCVSTWTSGEGARRVDSQGASMYVAGVDDKGRFVARAEWTEPKILGGGSGGTSTSFLWEPSEGLREIHRHLGRRDVAGLVAVDMNNKGQITGLLRLRGQAEGVVLEPVEPGHAQGD
jgi:uncharacterized membrane protein